MYIFIMGLDSLKNFKQEILVGLQKDYWKLELKGKSAAEGKIDQGTIVIELLKNAGFGNIWLKFNMSNLGRV